MGKLLQETKAGVEACGFWSLTNLGLGLALLWDSAYSTSRTGAGAKDRRGTRLEAGEILVETTSGLPNPFSLSLNTHLAYVSQTPLRLRVATWLFVLMNESRQDVCHFQIWPMKDSHTHFPIVIYFSSSVECQCPWSPWKPHGRHRQVFITQCLWKIVSGRAACIMRNTFLLC